MITLKLKYKTDDGNMSLINDYQRQYSVLYRWMCNRALEDKSESYREKECKALSNIDLMDSWFVRSAVKESTYLKSLNAGIIVFGGKKNFFDRCKGNITKEEYRERRLSPVCSIGESDKKGNRKFVLTEDLRVLFKPNRKTKIYLDLYSLSKEQRKVLKRLYSFQSLNFIPVTYKLDKKHVYISFDESMLYLRNKSLYRPIQDRIMSIDMNPNYIGWSIVDWKSEEGYKVIKSGIYSIKGLNDEEFALKKQKVPSTDPKRIYLANKRHNEVYEIAKNLINICRHYRCEMFAYEDLAMPSKDNKRGKRFNRLVNNLWCRNIFIKNIIKRCNISGIQHHEVASNYSSFIGNVLYRNTNEPDMVLASIEVGRRGYEFNRQYIRKDKEQKKNIIQPVITSTLKQRIAESMEEICYPCGEVDDLVELYYKIKNAGTRYRVPLGESRESSRCFSHKSKLVRY